MLPEMTYFPLINEPESKGPLSRLLPLLPWPGWGEGYSFSPSPSSWVTAGFLPGSEVSLGILEPKALTLGSRLALPLFTETCSSQLSTALTDHLLLILIKDGSREATETLAGKRLLAGNVTGRRAFRYTWNLSSAAAVATLEWAYLLPPKGPSALGTALQPQEVPVPSVVRDTVPTVRQAVKDIIDPHLGAWDASWFARNSYRRKGTLLFGTACTDPGKAAHPGTVAPAALTCSHSAVALTPGSAGPWEQAEVRRSGPFGGLTLKANREGKHLFSTYYVPGSVLEDLGRQWTEKRKHLLSENSYARKGCYKQINKQYVW